MNRALQWGLAATLMISGMVMLTACTDNDDNSVPTTTEEDVTTYVASDYWATCNKPTYIGDISMMPADMQTAIRDRFPNQVASIDEAEIAFACIDNYDLDNWETENLAELSELAGKLLEMQIERDGLVVLLSKDGSDVFPDGQDNMLPDWNKVLWASHGHADSYYLLDEKEEQQQGMEFTKDAEYWSTRLTPFVKWIDYYDSEIAPADAPAQTRTRANDNLPTIGELKANLKTDAQHIDLNFPIILIQYIDKAALSDADFLFAFSSVSVRLSVMPIYMQSVNGASAGDYYAVRSDVIPHNDGMWRPQKKNHGAPQIRIYGYWFKEMTYAIALADDNGNFPLAGLHYIEGPLPKNQISSTDYSESFTASLNGSLKGGGSKKAGSGEKGWSAEGSVGFSLGWSESVKYSLQNIAYSRNSSTSTVTYRWYSNNVELKDAWDDMNKYFKPDTHQEFDCENVWLWHVPYGSNGVEDGSKTSFNIVVGLEPQYSVWHGWRGLIDDDDDRQDFSCGFKSATVKIDAPDRSTWGVISLKNASNSFTMRNIKIYKKGKENKSPVATISNTYKPQEQAQTAVDEGTYTVTFEYINPDNNKVIKTGTLSNVTVSMGRTIESATTSLSTGEAILKP